MYSQNKQIIEYLKSGHSLTGLEALEKFGCFRLASRINDLNRMGYNIVSDKVKDGKKHYSRYYLFCK